METALPDSCDVLVIGGGPAGACAARAAAEAGADTCLIEEDGCVGEPVRCAEGVSLRAVRAFLGDPAPGVVCTRIRHVRLSGPSGRGVTLTSELEGCILDRRRFDLSLAERAAGSGAAIFTRTRARGMSRADQGWAVEAERDARLHTIAARIVIGADGVVSRVGRWAGLDTRVKPDQIGSCYQYRLGGLDLDEDTIELAWGSRIAPGGYGWIFPKGSGDANVGVGIRRSRALTGLSAREYLDRWVAERFPRAVRRDTTGGAVITDPRLTAISGPGILLVGDAARQLNPLSLAGISSGMRGGWLAGTIAARACASGRTGAAPLRQYDRRWRRLLGRLHEDHHRLAEVIHGLPDSTFEALVSELQDRDPAQRRIHTAISAAVRRHPLLLLTIVPYFRHWRAGGNRSGYPEPR